MVTLVPQAGQLHVAPALVCIRLRPPIGRRVRLTGLELTDLSHVEQYQGLRLPSGGHSDHAAALGGLDKPPRVPPGRQVSSRDSHADVERNLSGQSGPWRR